MTNRQVGSSGLEKRDRGADCRLPSTAAGLQPPSATVPFTTKEVWMEQALPQALAITDGRRRTRTAQAPAAPGRLTTAAPRRCS